MSKIDLLQMSTEQLEAALLEKKAKERQDALKKREEYEERRNALVFRRIKQARRLSLLLNEFKRETLEELEAFSKEANMYGDIRSNSKGGFGLRHSETGEKVSLDRNVVSEYDERAAMAETLIKEFLEDKVKKRDVPTFKTINALLSKNKSGDFTPSQVARLLSIRDNYTDERWVKAIKLFEESYQVREISYSVSFFEKDGMNKDTPILLSFAAIPVEAVLEEKEEA